LILMLEGRFGLSSPPIYRPTTTTTTTKTTNMPSHIMPGVMGGPHNHNDSTAEEEEGANYFATDCYPFGKNLRKKCPSPKLFYFLAASITLAVTLVQVIVISYSTNSVFEAATAARNANVDTRTMVNVFRLAAAAERAAYNGGGGDVDFETDGNDSEARTSQHEMAAAMSAHKDFSAPHHHYRNYYTDEQVATAVFKAVNDLTAALPGAAVVMPPTTMPPPPPPTVESTA
jgi:hypothetical protein